MSMLVVVGGWVWSRRDAAGKVCYQKGDNMSAIHWVNRCTGGTEPRSGAFTRMLGCLEMDSGWSFRVKNVAGIANTLADGISRWQRASINFPPREFRPDINWQEQRLGFAGEAFCSEVLASSTSETQLWSHLNRLTRQVSHFGPGFAGEWGGTNT